MVFRIKGLNFEMSRIYIFSSFSYAKDFGFKDFVYDANGLIIRLPTSQKQGLKCSGFNKFENAFNR